jgi:hypothetical protein
MGKHHQSPIRIGRAAAPRVTVKATKASSIDIEKEYTVVEVAALMSLSRQTITRAFEHRSGIHTIPGRGEQMIIRIPGHILVQWLRERTKP